MRPTLGLAAALCASVLLLSGCAIPIGVQIAKWSIDGISYLTTQKSTTDHALSLITGQDCAIHRIVIKGIVCSEADDGGKIVVDLDRAPAAVPEAEFDTAAGEAKPAPQPERPSVESRLDTGNPKLIEARAHEVGPAIR